ncbi:MAG: tRNA lysidine(34) synthetase TilS, partial [Clostridia bacterium]|nr:tRNA lysidine(34) synthetase TilS [Clostridia bacterium]
ADGEACNVYKELIYKVCINDKIIDNLFIRNRRPGDKYFYKGHHRRLKELLREAGVPIRERETLPLICDGDGILWVPGLPPRDGETPDGDDKGYLILTYSKHGKADEK